MKVEFLKDTEPYTKGDVVYFPEDRAEDLIRQGLVKQVDENTEAKIQAEEKAEEKAKANIENKAIEGGENK